MNHIMTATEVLERRRLSGEVHRQRLEDSDNAIMLPIVERLLSKIEEMF